VRLVLLGDPVAHSRSPAMHTAALGHLGIDGTYQARRVDAAGMRTAIQQIRAGEIDGANVTMPHKSLAAELCDTLAVEAALARAANTLALRDGLLTGWNTDAIAFRTLLDHLPGDPVLVIGAGGAAAAVAAGVAGRSIEFMARRPAAAAHLGRPVAWGTVRPGALVVNATPLGMHGESLPRGVVESASGLVDLAYGREPTPACTLARMAGLPCVDGIQFLVAQAAESFAIWTGRRAPRDVMEQAARR
jgi:shikimate dehydrogenase